MQLASKLARSRALLAFTIKVPFNGIDAHWLLEMTGGLEAGAWAPMPAEKQLPWPLLGRQTCQTCQLLSDDPAHAHCNYVEVPSASTSGSNTALTAAGATSG